MLFIIFFCRIEVLNNAISMCFMWALFVRVICTYVLMPYICCQLKNTNSNICMTKDLVKIWTAILWQIKKQKLYFLSCSSDNRSQKVYTVAVFLWLLSRSVCVFKESMWVSILYSSNLLFLSHSLKEKRMFRIYV